jgi:hypothetical protein
MLQRQFAGDESTPARRLSMDEAEKSRETTLDASAAVLF